MYYGVASVLGTIAIVAFALGRGSDPVEIGIATVAAYCIWLFIARVLT